MGSYVSGHGPLCYPASSPPAFEAVIGPELHPLLTVLMQLSLVFQPLPKPHRFQIILPPGHLIMRPALFKGYGLGRPKGLFAVDRNVTVRSADPSQPAAIDWAMMDATMLLKGGRTLEFDDIAVQNIRCAACACIQSCASGAAAGGALDPPMLVVGWVQPKRWSMHGKFGGLHSRGLG